MWNVVDLRLTHFAPGLLVPLSSYPALISGFLLLYASIYTHTITAQSLQAQCTLTRLVLAPPAILLFWNFGFNASYNAPGVQVAVGMAVVGLYGIMRVIDTCIVPLIDPIPSVWIRKEEGVPMPIPTSTKERLIYTFDLATSLRGTSWFSDRHWNWVPSPLVNASTTHLTRRAYLSTTLLSFVVQYLFMDVIDSINKSRTWDITQRYPITSLPFPEQMVFAICVCGSTILSISVMYTLVALVAVSLGSSPVNWPPMFDRPFHSGSLKEFWSRRWHAIFRRVFTRVSLLLLLPIPKKWQSVRIFIRMLIIFVLSAGMHVMLMYRLEREPSSHTHASLVQIFTDPSILAFFLLQPVGLAVEALVVLPLVSSVPTARREKEEKDRKLNWIGMALMRVWSWGFMLWAGRFWSDAWVRRGFWEEREHVVGWSLVRGVLKGEWKA
ncbi:uncharacterized protein FOMMEDRAFT_165054 [Fomitiporia mediterranea MF3/22]|uniref:uncharacterized protein n=1 Tax=Fomitiporia mediterranea (strain MF3/22) TaxID=694068 RepID=UPI0004407879|nr:uncharacterized protein FOMMEDRAFT_165054 [Fomitiporia mediterranea MF3/22]EJD08488.1 hypothetical protein FOMMEDRAFT_165054 [Fomitiporia mediterranea MF3/22]